jgi:hypothetical protein
MSVFFFLSGFTTKNPYALSFSSYPIRATCTAPIILLDLIILIIIFSQLVVILKVGAELVIKI